MEIFKDIPGFEGLYQASSEGYIKSLGRVHRCKNGHTRTSLPKVMRGRGKSASGYRVTLWKDGKQSEWLVHRLIALSFLGEPPEGYTVNHIDGNRFNNRISNLEWLSLGDNIRYGHQNGQYHNQTSIQIVAPDGCIKTFHSLAACSQSLGRGRGYMWQCLHDGTVPTDIYGNVYRVIPF